MSINPSVENSWDSYTHGRTYKGKVIFFHGFGRHKYLLFSIINLCRVQRNAAHSNPAFPLKNSANAEWFLSLERNCAKRQTNRIAGRDRRPGNDLQSWLLFTSKVTIFFCTNTIFMTIAAFRISTSRSLLSETYILYSTETLTTDLMKYYRYPN